MSKGGAPVQNKMGVAHTLLNRVSCAGCAAAANRPGAFPRGKRGQFPISLLRGGTCTNRPRTNTRPGTLLCKMRASIDWIQSRRGTSLFASIRLNSFRCAGLKIYFQFNISRIIIKTYLFLTLSLGISLMGEFPENIL